ncbi:KEOPS complex N(6)-L-threonylcarbamoyladenine synthase Kae1 [Candidatus Aenigmatarchaeota archaeon]
MICLGIESTAHTFGIGVMDDKGKILANVRDTYKPPEGWGMKPIDVAEHHKKVKESVLEKALKEAKVTIDKIDVIAFSQGPGLPPCLRVGKDLAVDLAKKNSKPLVPVNHCIAHIEIGRLFSKAKDPVTLFVSGGNTQILSHVEGRYRCFGETQDISVGNALDKLGRELGIGFPAGPKIEELAKKGQYMELPYVVKGMDLSFSGLVTEAAKRFKQMERKEDVCFSFQETAFAMLTEVTERALAHVKKNEVILTGGVAANRRFSKMLEIMCKERGAKFYVCPIELSGDNGAMIAWLGLLMKKAGYTKKGDLDIEPRQRTDDVDVFWL